MPEHSPAPTPHRAVYGFAWFLLFKTLLFVYLIWAFVPVAILENTFGVIYVPDKYFAIQLPVVVMTGLMFFAFLIYPAWNWSITANPNDVRTVWDRFSLRRCEYMIENHVICDNKITVEIASGWQIDKYCMVHNDTGILSNDYNQEKIENFCDCLRKSECYLAKNPEHIHKLRGKKMVPSVCDLDISDICRNLYRKKCK